MRKLLWVLLVVLAVPAAAQTNPPLTVKTAEPPPTAAAAPVETIAVTPVSLTKPSTWFQNLSRDIGAFNLVADEPGLSFHKPTYLIPYTYSPQYTGENAEVLFQLSLKHELYRRILYFGYTQKSFWQLYNSGNSRPFRETDYNPEIFFRFRRLGATHWGIDFGGDHESNGRPLPESRSWNRLFLAGYHETDRDLLYTKVWYRLPEKQRETPTDPKGDDNPDIEDFLGYGEIDWQRKFDNGQQVQMMLRANPATGNGALNLTWSAPVGDFAFWHVYAFHGYGEGLLDYNHRITRVGVGFMLAR
jgi:phospholipase A1